MKLEVEKKIKADKLNEVDIKGKISLKSGKLLAFINATTTDDPVAVDKFRRAVKDVLNLNL
jgi:hypothetical protein